MAWVWVHLRNQENKMLWNDILLTVIPKRKKISKGMGPCDKWHLNNFAASFTAETVKSLGSCILGVQWWLHFFLLPFVICVLAGIRREDERQMVYLTNYLQTTSHLKYERWKSHISQDEYTVGAIMQRGLE